MVNEDQCNLRPHQTRHPSNYFYQLLISFSQPPAKLSLKCRVHLSEIGVNILQQNEVSKFVNLSLPQKINGQYANNPIFPAIFFSKHLFFLFYLYSKRLFIQLIFHKNAFFPKISTKDPLCSRVIKAKLDRVFCIIGISRMVCRIRPLFPFQIRFHQAPVLRPK